MKITKKQAVIGCLIALAAAAPLTAFAIMFSSSPRVNRFQEGSVAIGVQESSDSGEQLTKTLTFDAEHRRADKPVLIRDTRTSPEEALRVCLVPMWYDSGGYVCGSVFDFTAPAWNSSGTALVYADGERTLTLQMDANWETNGWCYDSDEGWFLYTGALQDDGLTPQLLAGVVLSEEAYALTESYTLRIDVLADAVQTSGGAADVRGW